MTCKKTHCKHGHEFTEKNTYIDPRGQRVCRRCNSDAARRYKNKSGWYEKNGEKAIILSRKYYEQNRERQIDSVTRWKKNNRDNVKRYSKDRRERVRSGKVSENIREILFHAQEGECYYCHVDLDTITINLDHKISLCRGGEHADRNLCLACEKCNQRKGVKTPEEVLRGRHFVV